MARKLTRNNCDAGIFQLGAGPAADAVQVKIIANLDQTGRSKRLDRFAVAGMTDHPVAVQVLVERVSSDSSAGWSPIHR